MFSLLATIPRWSVIKPLPALKRLDTDFVFHPDSVPLFMNDL